VSGKWFEGLPLSQRLKMVAEKPQGERNTTGPTTLERSSLFSAARFVLVKTIGGQAEKPHFSQRTREMEHPA
jgi:hypothetical protein